VSSNEQQPHPLASEGGISESPADSRGPFEVLDDLMLVIEALCPTYPERDTFADSATFKL
jgi:hypothetical protein